MSGHSKDLTAAPEQIAQLREALWDAHERLEKFEPPNGRGLQLPGAYALDHRPGTYKNCTFCIALRATEDT